MLKWNRDKFKGFGMGVITTLLFASLVGTAFASGQLKSINVVQGGIKLFVDGKLIKPTDVKGNVVEPFIYDGTTYLPLRALSNALTNYEKPVTWDGATSSVYVGQAPVAEQTDIAELKIHEHNEDAKLYTGQNAAFGILDKQITPFNRFSRGEFTYVLNSNYSQLNGQFVVPYSNISNNNQGSVTFYNVDKKGNQTQIASFRTIAGDESVQVSVDLKGVEILKISNSGDYSLGAKTFYETGTLFNVTLAGIK